MQLLDKVKIFKLKWQSECVTFTSQLALKLQHFDFFQVKTKGISNSQNIFCVNILNNLGEIWDVNIAFLPFQRLVTVTSLNFQAWKFGKLTSYMYRTTIPSFSSVPFIDLLYQKSTSQLFFNLCYKHHLKNALNKM